MSELEPFTYGSADNYSDLVPVKPEVEYASSPETEATQLLKIYGQGALELLSADAADGETVSRLSGDIALLRAQNPHEEIKPFFTVNFSDKLTPKDLHERFVNLCAHTSSLSINAWQPNWSGWSDQELNRRNVNGVEVSHLSLRGMILRRDKDGRLAYPDYDHGNNVECHHVLASNFGKYRFEKRFPGRTLMNLTDLLMMSAMSLVARDKIIEPVFYDYMRTAESWSFRSPFLGFKINTVSHPLVNVTVNRSISGMIELTSEPKISGGDIRAPMKVPFYDSVGITLR